MENKAGQLGRRLLALFAIASVATMGALAISRSAEGVDPFDCSSYAEKRVWLESQSWVEPQPSIPAGHPNAGKQGHIHVGTCFPLNQTINGATGTIPFDLYLQLHNVTGRAWRLRAIPYLNGQPPPPHITPLNWTCDVADCNQWLHIDFPLSLPAKAGVTELGFWLDVELPNGDPNVNFRQWYNVNRWFVDFQNGKPALPDPQTPYVGGDTWLPTPVMGGSNYSKVRVESSVFPWDQTTGQTIPKSGTWVLPVKFQTSYQGITRTGKALIDPALHAVPPNFGAVVYDGPAGDKLLSINTLPLSNGPHRLLLISCADGNGTTGAIRNCGVLVVPFTVAN